MMTIPNNYQRILFLVRAKLTFLGTRLRDVLLHIFWSKEEHIIWTYLIPIIKPLKKKIDYMFLELNFYISNYVLIGSFVKNRDNSISVRVGLPKHKFFILVVQIIQVCSLILTLCFYLLVDDFQKNSEIILFLIVFSNMVTFLNCFIDLLRIEKRKMVYYTFSGYHNPSATQREHKQTLRKNFLYHSCRMLLKNDFLCKQITILFTAIFSFFLFIVISLFEISIIDILHELEKSNLYFLSLIFFISILMFWYTRRHKRFIVKKRNSKSYYLTKSVYTFTDGLRLSWISLIALVCLFDPKLVYETRDSIVNFFISSTSDSFFSINLLGGFLIGSGFTKCLELPLVDSACGEGGADDSIPSIFRKLNPDKCFEDYAHDEDVVRPFIDSKKYSQNVYNLKEEATVNPELLDSLNRKLEVELIKERTALSYNKNVLEGNKIRQDAIEHYTKTFTDCIMENSTSTKLIKSCSSEADLCADLKNKLEKANAHAKMIRDELSEEEVYHIERFREHSESMQKKVEEDLKCCEEERELDLKEQRNYCEYRAHYRTHWRYARELAASEEKAAADKKLLDFLKEKSTPDDTLSSPYEQLNDKNKLVFIQFMLITILISLFFKLVAAPFHFWAVSVYEGSPTSSTVFFSLIPKISTFVIFLRAFYESFFSFFINDLHQYIGIVALLSICIGAIAGLAEKKLKSLLAYSSINNTGFILLPLITSSLNGIQVMFFYLTVYVCSSLSVWSVLLTLKTKVSVYKKKLTKDFADLASLRRTNPFLSFLLSFTLLSLAGMPPFIGFLAKTYVFLAVTESYLFLISFLTILFSLISIFYYLRLIKIVYFEKVIVTKLHKNLTFKSSSLNSFFSLFLLYLFIYPNFLLLLVYKVII